MPNYTHICIEGHLGQKPDVKESQAGKSWCSFSVGVSGWKDKDGNQRPTTWFAVKAFGKSAENLADADKGDAVVIMGRCETEEWEAREGGTRSRMVVMAEHVHVIKWIRASGYDDERTSKARTEKESRRGDVVFNDDEVPF